MLNIAIWRGVLSPPSIPRRPALRRSSRAGRSPPVRLVGASAASGYRQRDRLALEDRWRSLGGAAPGSGVSPPVVSRVSSHTPKIRTWTAGSQVIWATRSAEEKANGSAIGGRIERVAHIYASIVGRTALETAPDTPAAHEIRELYLWTAQHA